MNRCVSRCVRRSRRLFTFINASSNLQTINIFTIWQFFFRRAMWVGTVLITTYLSSLQIPKENKSWVVFTSKKKIFRLVIFFTEFVSKNFMGDLQPWKYKKNSGVVWSFLGWWEWWVRLWVRFPTRNMMCFKFFCCKISRKNNLKKKWWEIVHKSVNLDSR